MQFTELLVLAGDEVLQELLGTSTLRLIRLLDPHNLAPDRLQAILLRLRSGYDLLANRDSRNLLLSLLPIDQAQQLATILGIQSADPYQALNDLKIRRHSPQERALFSFFELPELSEEAHQEVLSTKSVANNFPLFLHQRQVARRVSIALTKNSQRVLLHMPTGAGKTRTAMHIIADHLRNYEPTLVIWLAYSEELCDQAATEFERAWTHLGNREIQVYRFWGEHKLSFDTITDGFVVASLTKLYRASIANLSVISSLAARSSLVIIDEAHQAIAQTYRLLLDTLVTQGRNAALLGLTATPGRTWNDIDADIELARFFGQQKVTLQIEDYPNPIDYLVSEGYLAKAIYRPLFYPSSTTLSEADLRRIESELDIPHDILQRISMDEQRNLAIIAEVEQLIKRHKRIIIFASTVSHAQLLAVVLVARGHASAAVTSETPIRERTTIIETYKSSTSEPIILCNFGVLTTGFDAPQTSATIIARPTQSLVLYSQMVGRAIRGVRVGGNQTAEIVTVVDTQLTGFGNLVEAFSNWEDVWSEL